MKVTIGARGLRIELEWAAVRALIRQLTLLLKMLLPLLSALMTFLAAPALLKLGSMLQWW